METGAPEPSPSLPRTQHSLADSSNPELSDEPAVDVRSSEDWGQDFEPSAGLEPGSGDRARLMEALSVTPVPVDNLVTTAGLPVSTVQTLLLELDLAGRIEWSSGQLVALKP